MKKLILAPKSGEAAYRHAAKVFKNMYMKVTGTALDIVYEDDGASDLIIIGNDAVNDFLTYPMLWGEIRSLGIRYGTDDYCIRSHKKDGRTLLILAGGRGRSTIYAVYDFFERQANCHYFWDGDVIPHSDEVAIEGLDILESPRFNYRGLRYFAHRGLHRFQAEHWSLDDWKREIDWMMKKRLNFFMLRIGMDDLWQRVFPDEIPYPDPNESQADTNGYDDRSVFWPLEFRGILRKKILEYAFECDLTHPEDCGTMTHWYSPTPAEFLASDKNNVTLMTQADNQYYEPTTQIWDITKQENVDNYLKLTEGYVNEFNPQCNLFHTIGMGERRMMPDAESNHRLKLFAYRKISQSLRERYPTSKLMLASWDFVGWWTNEEVQNLISELDPERTLILDYTSDVDDPECSFLKWGIVGKFPYIFGIFYAYEPESSLRGPYERYDERLKVAVNDPMCKGMVLWPELSHSDPLVLEYLTENSWSPLKMNIEEITERFCQRRYGKDATALNNIWQMALPIIKTADWGGYTGRPDNDPESDRYILKWDVHRELWFDCKKIIAPTSSRVLRHYQYRINIYRPLILRSAEILDELANIPILEWDNLFIKRDCIDIARTIVGRYMNILLFKARILTADSKAKYITEIKKVFMPLICRLRFQNVFMP